MVFFRGPCVNEMLAVFFVFWSGLEWSGEGWEVGRRWFAVVI